MLADHSMPPSRATFPRQRLASRVVIGALGVLLSLAVLATSALLRLATTFQDGIASTSLPQAVEDPVRLVHRIAAMGISGLAAWAFVLAWRARTTAQPKDQGLRIATVILLLTVVLSALGPFTPGYRFDAVTVGNVTGGVALVLAFQTWWWVTMQGRPGALPLPGIGRWTLIAYAAQTGLGALLSAQAMTHRFDALLPHLAVAIALVSCTMTWWAKSPGTRRATTLALALIAMQSAGGIALALLDERPLILALAHALLTPLIGMALLGAGCSRMGAAR